MGSHSFIPNMDLTNNQTKIIMADLIIHTGLNKDGNAVIIMSPEIYDKFVEECTNVTDGIIEHLMLLDNEEKRRAVMRGITILIEIGKSPKIEDIIKNMAQNN